MNNNYLLLHNINNLLYKRNNIITNHNYILQYIKNNWILLHTMVIKIQIQYKIMVIWEQKLQFKVIIIIINNNKIYKYRHSKKLYKLLI